MSNKVILYVSTEQNNVEEGLSNMSFATEGTIYKKESSIYITYVESEVTGMEGTTTTIKIKDDIVTIMRFGAISSQLVFEKNKQHISYYETKQGSFSIGVTAKKLDIDIDENGGSINAEYVIQLNNSDIGKNKFHLNIKPVKKA